MRIAAAFTGLVVALTVLRSLDADRAFAYANAVYGPLTRLAGRVVTPAPWSWTVVLLVAAVLAMCVLTLRRGVRNAPLVVALAVLVAWTWSTAVWGVHYQRAPWADRRGLPAETRPADVATLARFLRDTVTDAATELRTTDRDAVRAIAAISAALERRTADEDDLAVDVPARVKVVPAGMLLAFGTSGVISPWLLEAHVDGGLPDAARVAVAAHELAHLAGHAREDDAEAVGAIAGLGAADPFARYAVALFQLTAAASALPPGEREHLVGTLPAVARDDLASAREAARRYVRPGLAEAQRWVYEQYLRAQGIPEGAASYAQSTTLLARALQAGELSDAGGDAH